MGSAGPHTIPERPEWTEAAVGGRSPELGAGGTVDLIVPDPGGPQRNTVKATLLYSGQSVVTSLGPVALYPAELLSGRGEVALELYCTQHGIKCDTYVFVFSSELKVSHCLTKPLLTGVMSCHTVLNKVPLFTSLGTICKAYIDLLAMLCGVWFFHNTSFHDVMFVYCFSRVYDKCLCHGLANYKSKILFQFKFSHHHSLHKIISNGFC